MTALVVKRCDIHALITILAICFGATDKRAILTMTNVSIMIGKKTISPSKVITHAEAAAAIKTIVVRDAAFASSDAASI